MSAPLHFTVERLHHICAEIIKEERGHLRVVVVADEKTSQITEVIDEGWKGEDVECCLKVIAGNRS